MTIRRLAASMTMLALFVSLDTALAQSSPELGKLEGEFVFAGGATQRQAIATAIDKAVDEIIFLARPFARSRLEETNAPIGRVQIAADGSDIIVIYDQKTKARSPADGRKIQWKSPLDGTNHKLSTLRQGDRLIQTFAGEEGTRRNAFVLEEEGRQLRMNVTISSPRLPKDLKYTLTYRRK